MISQMPKALKAGIGHMPLRILLDDVVVDTVQERYNRVNCEGSLHNVWVQLVQAELTVAIKVMRVIGRCLVLLVLHEEEVPNDQTKLVKDCSFSSDALVITLACEANERHP